jgi:hypothetical protein
MEQKLNGTLLLIHLRTLHEKIDGTQCCNPFLGPHTKYKKKSKTIIKNNSNEKRMSRCPENGQKLVEEV